MMGIGADLSLPSIQLPTISNRNTQLLQDQQLIIKKLSQELSINDVRK